MKKLGQERLAIGYSCPVEATVDIIGGKWKSLILFHLLPFSRVGFFMGPLLERVHEPPCGEFPCA